ncbi:ribonuclease inhibitor [Silvimonas terrae]|uniref:Ribonuclease inhibitor n=1 Tax=Silvimonas terrae TaxID=300266 RepID=A0A840RCM5_9NEIS|nr:barstar family protein [Silvimonas terrae]MBB5190288.1 ribonuclease inhibitor [Silvimonas terrae]
MSVKKARQVTLSQVHTLDDVYDQFAAQLALPEYFGRNLDALYDALTGDVTGPLRIVWQDAGAAAQSMGKKHYAAVIEVFNDVGEERDDLEVVIS